MVLARAPELPNSIALDTAFSLALKEVRLAEGEPEGEEGEPTSDLRFPGGNAGDSQKNEPRPGEPEKEDATRDGAGESRSISDDLGDGTWVISV